MLMLVIVLNLLISIASFYLAWKIWQLRRILNQATVTLTQVERRTYRVLHRAPEFATRGKTGTRRLRAFYQRLESQLQQLEQILLLLNLMSRIWRFNRRPWRLDRRRKRRIFL